MTALDTPFSRAALFMAAIITGLAGAVVVPAAAAQTLDLSISPSSISFANADPDSTPSIAAPAITVGYRVRGNSGGNWQITLLASGDSNSGSAVIPISNVTWTASPVPPFQSGTLSNTLSQTLASGSGNVQSNAISGSVVFMLANLWSYSVGTYSTSIVFTLTAP